MELLESKTKSLILGWLLFLQTSCSELWVNLGVDIDQANITNVLDNQNDYITYTYDYNWRSKPKTVLKSQVLIKVSQWDMVFINSNNLTINFWTTGAYRTSEKSANQYENIYNYAMTPGW
jgi:hypothetical protein